MPRQFLVPAGEEVEYDCVVVALLTHSETLAQFALIVVDGQPAEDDKVRVVERGQVRHAAKGKEYWVNGDVGFPAGERGVWYTQLYPVEEPGVGPHWYRPFHTPDGAGWLDEVEGGPRFKPVDW